MNYKRICSLMNRPEQDENALLPKEKRLLIREYLDDSHCLDQCVFPSITPKEHKQLLSSIKAKLPFTLAEDKHYTLLQTYISDTKFWGKFGWDKEVEDFLLEKYPGGQETDFLSNAAGIIDDLIRMAKEGGSPEINGWYMRKCWMELIRIQLPLGCNYVNFKRAYNKKPKDSCYKIEMEITYQGLVYMFNRVTNSRITTKIFSKLELSILGLPDDSGRFNDRCSLPDSLGEREKLIVRLNAESACSKEHLASIGIYVIAGCSNNNQEQKSLGCDDLDVQKEHVTGFRMYMKDELTARRGSTGHRGQRTTDEVEMLRKTAIRAFLKHNYQHLSLYSIIGYDSSGAVSLQGDELDDQIGMTPKATPIDMRNNVVQ